MMIFRKLIAAAAFGIVLTGMPVFAAEVETDTDEASDVSSVSVETEEAEADTIAVTEFTEQHFKCLTTLDNNVIILGYDITPAGSLVIPDTLRGMQVSKIELAAFSHCTGITSLSLPAHLKTIGADAFSGCTGITGDVIIPDTVTSIESLAFFNCRNITGLKLSSGLEHIGLSAFEGCRSVTGELRIPATVSEFGDKAFKYFGSADKCTLTLPEGLKCIGEEAFYGSGFSGTVTIPSSLTVIEAYAFYDCTYITGLKISPGVATIGEYAFKYCGLKGDLDIPVSTSVIGASAFFACTGLDGALTLTGALSSAGENAFLGLYNISKINNRSFIQFKAEHFINDDTFFQKTDTKEKVEKSGSIGNGIYRRRINSPSVSSVKNKASSVTVKCTKIEGATGYVFERKVNGGKWKKIKTQDKTTLVDSTARTNGSKYSYRVYAFMERNGAVIKSERSASRFTYYVKRPKLKRVTSSSKNSFTAKWQKPNRKTLTAYEVQYSTSSGFSDPKIKRAGKNATSATVRRLKGGKYYYVRVRAYKKSNSKKYYSPWSKTIKVKIKK